MEEIKIQKKMEPEELSFGMIMGTIAGIFVGIIVGLGIMLFSFDNDAEEKDCVNFYKKNNYITDKCEVYKDKLVNINK